MGLTVVREWMPGFRFSLHSRITGPAPLSTRDRDVSEGWRDCRGSRPWAIRGRGRAGDDLWLWPWGFLEGLVEGTDGGGAVEAFAFHELLDGAELEARILPGAGRVRVEAGVHSLGDPLAGGRLEGDEDTHGGLLAVEHAAQVAHVFDAGLAALDLKEDRLGVGGAGVVAEEDFAVNASRFLWPATGRRSSQP